MKKHLEILPLTSEQVKTMCNRWFNDGPLSKGDMMRLFETAYRGATETESPEFGTNEWIASQKLPTQPNDA